MLAKKVKRVQGWLCLRALISVTFYCCCRLSLSDSICVWLACCCVIVKAWIRRKIYKLLKGPGWWVFNLYGVEMGWGRGRVPSALPFDWGWCRSFVLLQACRVWIGFHAVLLLCEISVAFIYMSQAGFTVSWRIPIFIFIQLRRSFFTPMKPKRGKQKCFFLVKMACKTCDLICLESDSRDRPWNRFVTSCFSDGSCIKKYVILEMVVN